MQNNRKPFARILSVGTTVFLLLFLTGGIAQAKRPIIIFFADNNWDSILVHNRIAAYIIEHGMGYRTDFIRGETTRLYRGLTKGYVDIYMESWTENYQDTYDKVIKSGNVIDLGPNYSDTWQGWAVPTYVIMGDPMRGITPVAPDLKSVMDISKYWKLFRHSKTSRLTSSTVPVTIVVLLLIFPIGHSFPAYRFFTFARSIPAARSTG